MRRILRLAIGDLGRRLRGVHRLVVVYVVLIGTALLLAVPAAGQQVRFSLAPRPVIEDRLRQFGGDDLQRESALKKLFADAGCPDLTEQPVKGLKQPNVLCRLPGESGETIVVGAHFDHVDRGSGVVDNWSGASLLPSLMWSLSYEPRRYTFLFIGFAGEERGELGSNFYAHHLTKDQKAKLRAMVNLDTLGLGPSEVWASRADPRLVNALARMAMALKLPLTAVNVDGVGSTDSEQFRAINIPAVTIHSVTQETLHILHSPEDKLASIKLDDYYQTYHLVAGFLAYLDGEWERSQPVVNASGDAKPEKSGQKDKAD